MLTVLDVDSRWVMGHYMGWSIRKVHVKALFEQILSSYSLPEMITARSDNGSQFIAVIVREYLADMDVAQEFTRPATPQQNGYVEAWHSIIERSICRKMELMDLDDARRTLREFVNYYNTERIHSGVGFKSAQHYLIEKGFCSIVDHTLNHQKHHPLK